MAAPLLAAAAAVAGMEGETVRPAIPAAPEVVARGASLRLGHAEVVRFGEPVGTIIVGDSGILDATAVNDRTVVLTALSAGSTNVVVLGREAQVLSRLNVRVGVPQEPRSEVYRGRERTVLVCNPDCVPLDETSEARSDAAEGGRPAAQAEPAAPGAVDVTVGEDAGPEDGDNPEPAE